MMRPERLKQCSLSAVVYKYMRFCIYDINFTKEQVVECINAFSAHIGLFICLRTHGPIGRVKKILKLSSQKKI